MSSDQEEPQDYKFKGYILKFLTTLNRLDYKHYMYDKIDHYAGMVTAKRLEEERNEILHGAYQSDKHRTVAKYRK